jgi:hypothetical protein
MSAKSNSIDLGGRRYNGEWLRSMSEGEAVLRLKGHCDINQIRNAWKQANGKSVRNYSAKTAKSGESKAKRARKPKVEKESK